MNMTFKRERPKYSNTYNLWTLLYAKPMTHFLQGYSHHEWVLWVVPRLPQHGGHAKFRKIRNISMDKIWYKDATGPRGDAHVTKNGTGI